MLRLILFILKLLEHLNSILDKSMTNQVRISMTHTHTVIINNLLLFYFYYLIDQCYLQKWLLLSDPESPSLGAKGYLLFSVHVLSPGVVPKPYPPLNTENIDIER